MYENIIKGQHPAHQAYICLPNPVYLSLSEYYRSTANWITSPVLNANIPALRGMFSAW